MQRLDILVRQARGRSGNQDHDADMGTPQREYVAYANDAQMRLYNLIQQCRPSLFLKQSYIDTVAGQAEYTLPTDVFLKHNLVTVHFTPNGNAQLYYPLDQRYPRNEVSIRALPDSYFLRAGKLVLSPLPMTGYTNGLRITYQYTIPTLDIRRAKITSVNTGAGTLTLTDDSTLTTENEDELSNGWVDYICVVDKDGTLIDQARALSSYNSTTKVLTLTSLSGSAAAANQYVVFGNYATTHSQLPDVAERYLVEYMTLRAQASDTSSEVAVTSPILRSIEQEIISAVENLEEDIFAVPLLDTQFLNYSDDWEN